MSTQKILSRLQSGLGAAKLSPNITKISVSLATKGKNECAGARHFIKEDLPGVQYNNPAVEYEIIKSPEAATKPVLTVSFADQSTKTIELARQQSSSICKQLMEIAA
ncbi:hypothetical protein K450DRAFT_248270 [Umbelopsis ramanniana AG]|uniref:Ribosomal protein/NADH dehydrogenase domain-containing protein n=1 Tax=Umbelopsis ramanniana AG TaxID=1314678 RepID=A0AAD5E7I1_UMBRA|nr:uncharacterized protein K450DRAFT_248270 [Umbelopsis ramanniana AG]KAI8578134.1 hypothetical protein K450DRAFT_248270 [Umbelopsis ramanniana AG]